MTPDPATRARLLETALREAVAIIRGEFGSDWADHFGPFYELQERAFAAALTEPPGRGPETGSDYSDAHALCVDAKDYDALRRAVTDLCDGCHEELPARESYGRWYHERPDDEPRLRECRLSPSLRKALAAAGTDKATPGSEAPATPVPDGPDGDWNTIHAGCVEAVEVARQQGAAALAEARRKADDHDRMARHYALAELVPSGGRS